MRRGIAALIVAGCFIAVLVYTTMSSAPDVSDARVGAEVEQACEEAVRARVAGARFPIAPSTRDADGARLHLEGVVDAGPEGATVRRNYDCLVSRARGGYRADSVNVWQSH